MPELPDLQVFSRNLERKLSGKKVVRVTVSSSRIKGKAALQSTLNHQSIESVYREGKELRFRFGNGALLGMHLMLHGKLEITEGNRQPPHTVLALGFEDHSGLALTDYQGLAQATLNPPEPQAPDALSKALTADYLKEKLSGTRAAVKNFLMDQRIIRGIGNAYADEILWDARISPFSACNKIPGPAVEKLASSIRRVLTEAEKQIRKEYPDIIGGEVRDFLRIHNPKAGESPTGAPILKETRGTGKTYYTEEQKLYK
jgi:formamidopyrimidine-DNA glycosylase